MDAGVYYWIGIEAEFLHRHFRGNMPTAHLPKLPELNVSIFVSFVKNKREFAKNLAEFFGWIS